MFQFPTIMAAYFFLLSPLAVPPLSPVQPYTYRPQNSHKYYNPYQISIPSAACPQFTPVTFPNHQLIAINPFPNRLHPNFSIISESV